VVKPDLHIFISSQQFFNSEGEFCHRAYLYLLILEANSATVPIYLHYFLSERSISFFLL